MNDRRLVRHLAVVVVLKLVAIAALWSVFVRDARVGVDSDTAATHVTGTVRTVPPPTGASQ